MTINDMMKVRWRWTKSFLQLFWEKVSKRPGNGCWIWMANTGRDGYGKVKISSRTWRAHRVSWMFHNNANIPDGMMVLHRCDNPSCVNPKHLFLGSGHDNNMDALTKGRFHPRYGSNHTNSKLTESKVQQARVLFKTGQFSHGELAAKFGVSREAMSSAISRRSWKQVA